MLFRSQERAGELAKGDFGVSIRSREPVATMLVRRAPVTLQLTLYTVLLAVALGVGADLEVLAAAPDMDRARQDRRAIARLHHGQR